MKTFDEKAVVSYGVFQAEITKHLEMDALVQGIYGQENGQFHGCHVGCTLHSFAPHSVDDHSAYERLFGIPQVLARLFDAIHEGLDAEDTPAFLAAVRDTIKPDMDLGMVWPKLALWLLADESNLYRLNRFESVSKEINQVADVYRAWVEKGNPNLDAATYAARAAAYAAADAADAAADAARAATYAAADAADAAADAADAATYAARAATYAAADAADAAADAADAATYAARAAAYAANAAAYAAADAADFWPAVRDKLLSLIVECEANHDVS